MLDDAYTLEEDESHVVNQLANDTDPDGSIDPTTVTIESEPTVGAASVLPDGRVKYAAPEGSEGQIDTLVYRVCDDSGLCGTATIRITIIDD